MRILDVIFKRRVTPLFCCAALALFTTGCTEQKKEPEKVQAPVAKDSIEKHETIYRLKLAETWGPNFPIFWRCDKKYG